MNALGEFFRNLLVRTPMEILAGLLRLVLFLLLFLIVLLLRFIEWLKWLLHTTNLFPEETEGGCESLPEPIIRRPDPAIYSQSFLMSQGLPVTWDNPDINVALASNPGQIEPDSYHLVADTDYIVSVQVHNAATDPAIGVRVRLVYRPWSFNSPDLIPVEIDANGQEVFQFVDVAAMGAAVTQFRWHTPPVQPGQAQHFCLQAILSHPLDINPNNNIGQENTNVYSEQPRSVTPGELAEIEVPLHNRLEREERFRFQAHRYEINPTDQAVLKLKVTRGRPRLSPADRLGHLLPTVVREPEDVPPAPGPTAAASTRPRTRLPDFGRIVFGSPKARFKTAKTKYIGFEGVRSAILGRSYDLPAGMTVAVQGAPDGTVALGAGEERLATFLVQVPANATPGTRVPVNIVARTADGQAVGGVTVFFDIKP